MSIRTEKLIRFAALVAQDEKRFLCRDLLPRIDTGGAAAGSIAVARISDDGKEDLGRPAGKAWFKEGQPEDISTVQFACADWGASESVDDLERRRLANDTKGLLRLTMMRTAKAVRRTLAADEQALCDFLATEATWTHLADGSGADFTQFDQEGASLFKTLRDGVVTLEDEGASVNDMCLTVLDPALWNSLLVDAGLLASLPDNVDKSVMSEAELQARVAAKLGTPRVRVLKAVRKADRKLAKAGNRSKVRIGENTNKMLLHVNPTSVVAGGGGGSITSEGTAAARVVEVDYELQVDKEGVLDKYAYRRSHGLVALLPEWGMLFKNCIAG